MILIISVLSTTGITLNTQKILAATESVSATVEEQEGVVTQEAEESTTVAQENNVVEEITSLSIENQTTEAATQPVTTKEPTTNTVQTTTTTTSTSLKAWGKNSKGQFVNGNKKVIAGATMKGIDVSKWNGDINWKKVAKSDVDYAIIRCGYGDNITSQDDAYWEINVAGCEKYNIPYGVYIYSYATTVKQAKSEAAHVLRLIKGHTLNFPIYYDMEDAIQAKLTSAKRTKIANAFLNAIKAEGYECGIYANLNWWNNYLPASLAEQTTWKWVAQYNNVGCTYTGEYQMWQCTSQGKVSGIQGDVDINFWFGEVRTRLYDIQKSNQATTVSSPKPVKAPAKVTLKSVKKGKKKATVKWKKVSGAKGYQIQYSTSKKFTKKTTKSKTTTKTSITIKKLKSKNTYYFRVRAYKKNAAKQKIYSKKWSKVKSKKIK
jgi:GH25 family lysozyme M1 (1,4-beta-N-acetylmuramidase)